VDEFKLCSADVGCVYASDDLFEVRVENKGLFGRTGAEDDNNEGGKPSG
jgi:hypothetical protein